VNKGELRLAEARSIGRELARVYDHVVRSYQRLYQVSLSEADEKVQKLLRNVGKQELLDQDPEQISWMDLNSLASTGESLQVWEHIKETAREELSIGLTAAKVVEGYFSKPWERALFLAIRQGLIDEWQPREGLEMTLVDTLAISYFMYLFWMNQHVERATTRAEIRKNDLKKHGKWRTPRLDEAEATEQATVMADRFNRMFMRTLRALRDLRRYSPAINIKNAGQVNIADKQVNLK